MKSAYWDSSALVPVCARQKASPIVHRLLAEYKVVTWWATTVEIRSGLERLTRMGKLSPAEYSGGAVRLQRLRDTWQEVRPDDDVRSEAEALLQRFTLSAADSLQLAAAMAWTGGHPRGKAFICGDTRLLEAARQLGFQAVEA